MSRKIHGQTHPKTQRESQKYQKKMKKLLEKGRLRLEKQKTKGREPEQQKKPLLAQIGRKGWLPIIDAQAYATLKNLQHAQVKRFTYYVDYNASDKNLGIVFFEAIVNIADQPGRTNFGRFKIDFNNKTIEFAGKGKMF